MHNHTPPPPSRWAAYFEHHKDRPACALLRTALDLVAPGHAVDLGCGSGNDTRALLQAGWQVLAVDQDQAAIEMVTAIGKDHPDSTLSTAHQRFETLEALPPSSLIRRPEFARHQALAPV
ncbi:methyltransferase domain-containing protein [Pseudomonas sp. PSKL.D1]|uniref:methyltransferase domain-containing protein n=1 Tax=Pseudomonas sp. PSKL.D1 TaxID=3029060 RepID=UPI0023812030|nr:methyltransferase domain-containing protein [Pseudomonas sp. PSKL.D1]WDY59684.1 methyltransferase domain-containing protein [Pseudomonas sp. PSKL.D1]